MPSFHVALDIISLVGNASIPAGLSLDESDISWPSDKDKFKQAQLHGCNASLPSLKLLSHFLLQVEGFKSAIVFNQSVTCAEAGLPSGCKYYFDQSSNTGYRFYYPSDGSYQYLYETYPQQISPIDGVTDEHFKVWMRNAGLSPSF
jgi:hypothetical protein